MATSKQCLHNKTGQACETSVAVKGEGNCYNCSYDAEDNKNCRKFYPITITTIDIEE